MKKLRSLKALKTEAWQVFSRYIRNRDPRCVTCGGNNDHAGHYRHNTERNSQLGGNALWWNEKNVHSQCIGCNTYREGNLTAYALYLEDVYGKGILQEIDRLYRTVRKYSREDVQAIIDKYK